MGSIDPVFLDKKFSVARYMLRYVVGASTDELRFQQLHKVKQYRAIADTEIEGVIDENFANFNTSLARFASISAQLQETRDKVQEVSKRAADGRNILSSKTKNLRELLLHKYEAKNVIEIIDDIQRIEAAPAKIGALLDARDFVGAVDMFTHSLNLVFSERLVAFHAITGIRNALMECKQVIEDRIVQELQHVVYLKGAFANFAKANQYSLAAIEHELSNQSFFDNEFDKHILASQQQDKDANRFQFATDSSSSGGGRHAPNALEDTVRAAKKLHREMEVIGTLKSSIESELNEAVVQISLICRGIFNAGSYTSFDNSFTEKTFGSHHHSATFQTFLRLLFHVVRRIAQRHFLVSVYFNSDGENCNYGMQEVVTKISGLVERVLSEYLDESAAAETTAAVKAINVSVSANDLFKLSRNKPPSETATKLLHLPHEGDLVKGDGVEKAMTRVCEPSVFHLPPVYEDLELIAKDLQQYFHTSNPFSSSGIGAFLRVFVTQQWVPKVNAKAQQFLAMKYRSSTSLRRLPVPSDTSYQPPSVDSLLFIAKQIFEMMERMPDHALDLVSVLESTVAKWLEECSTIARDIREPTLNHRRIVQSVPYSELISAFHEYESWQQQHKAGPSRSFREPKTRPATLSTRILRPEEASRIVTLSESLAVSPPSQAAVLLQKETELERELYIPGSWSNGTKGLLMDNARIGMLAYINSACNMMADHLEKVRASSSAHSQVGNQRKASRVVLPSSTLQVMISKCQALADECLFFLRREVRLHAFYYLTQLTSQRFDVAEGKTSMAHDCVLSLNINLSAMENALRPYLSSDKMALVFDGIAALLSNILVSNLQQMGGCTFTKGGVQQMLLNIGALHQGLTGTLYSYPSVGRAGHHFEHAKRYFQLLNLSETQLEVFLIENRKAYAPDAFKALWRVETPHRQLAKGSVNKLDSILR